MSATVILVHGAWHGAWAWDAVIDGLRTQGVTAVAVELDLVTLHDDAAIVRRAVADQKAKDRPVLLVGHSYGGMAISEGGRDADELIFVCAVLPSSGASMLDMLSTGELSTFATTVSELTSDGAVTVNPDRAIDALYHRCPTAMAEAAIKRLRPTALACMSAPVTDPAWLHRDTSYIVCTDDRSIPSALQRDWGHRVQRAFELDADHYPFFSAEQPLIATLAERAASHG